MPYLVCDKCGSYYELQPNEAPMDFNDKCECGGNLKCVQNLKDVDESQKICPNCGCVMGDDDETCPACNFELETQPITEKQLIFGFLWYLPLISFFMTGTIIFIGLSGVIVLPLIFQSQSTNIYSDLGNILFFSFFTIGMFIVVIKSIERFRNRYLKWYKKENLNWSAIIVSFLVTLVIGIFGGRYLPDNVSLIGPVIGGFVGGLIVGNRYIDGIVNGGIPTGIAAFIGFPLLVIIFGSQIPIIINTPLGMSLFVTLSIAIPYFLLFFIIGSISGIVGVVIRKKWNS
ncbi:hypothetical protein DSECCO2_319240 [anaerobic digester metagenome]|jgi:hypothetical protein